ncbi:MAG: nucleotidyltransferase family protein [Candidatus Thioglobus sp.]|nr:nucleotidyltransferase family protein [Candidatus Thioglobus sp.]
MILAAGRGKRMMPLTKNTPKPLIKIQNKPLIEHSINSLKRANIKHIVINTSYLAQQLKSHLGNGADFGVHIIYSNEENSPLETAGGIIKALPLLGKRPFLVLNSDVICDYDLSKFKLPAGSLAHLLLVDNPAHNPAGDFTLSAAGAVKIQAENPLTFAGIGIYHPDFFQEYLGKTQKIPLAKLFKKASKNQQLSGEYFGGFWQDIGTPESVEFANNS